MMLLGCALYAGPVTPEKALQVAQSVFASAPGTKAAGESELKIVWDGEFEPATKAAQDPAFYVISRPEGGFVMVAGNDNVQPVLAFSFENDFVVEGMPDNVRWWMEQYKDHVRSSVSATPAVREQWEKYESTKASPVSPVTPEFLESRTNEWNQTNPANFFCPNVDGQDETSVCGCVALVTAEIMAWFGTSNPALDNFLIPGYQYTSENGKTVTINPHDLHNQPLWSQLKALKTSAQFYGEINGYNPNASATEINNKRYYGFNRPIPGTQQVNTLTTLGESLANLTYDIGTLLQAKYNDSVDPHTGTGAVTADVTRAVAPVFGYNNGARYVSKSSYTNGQWELLMKEQITQRPIIYTGPGHAYAADGYGTYDSKQYFHFNLGWGGQNNGYYTLDIQETLDNPHYAIIDFYPNPSHYQAQPVIGFTQVSGNKGGFSNVSGYYTNSLTFNLNNSGNIGSADFTGEFAIFVVNAAGTRGGSPVAIANVENEDPLPAGSYYPGISFNNVNVSASFGDQLVAYYKETGKETYTPFIFAPFDVILPALPVFPAAAIKRNASYSVGDYFVFELTNNSYTYQNSTWKVTAPDGTTTQYNMDDYHVQLTAAGDYKISCTTPDQETVVTYITVTAL